MPPTTDQSPSATRAPRPKRTLFCPDCWHESPNDGDWRVQATPSGAVRHCPVCGATVTDRSPDGARTPVMLDRSPTVPHTGGTLLARWVRLGVAWARWPCSGPAEEAPHADSLLECLGWPRRVFNSSRRLL